MNKENKTIAYVLIFSALLLAAPHIARLYYHDSIMSGEEPYYHAASARSLIEGGFSELSISSNPYHLILAFSGMIFGLDAASKLLPFVLGIFSALLFFLILRKVNIKFSGSSSHKDEESIISFFEENEKLIIMLILIASPAFIYLFSFSNYHAVPVFLTLLGIFLMQHDKKSLRAVSIIPFAFSMLFGAFNALFVIAVLLSYFIRTKSRIVLFVLFFVLLSSSALLPLYFYDKQEIIPRDNTERIKEIISDFGGLYGISAFVLLLSLACPFFIWKNIKKQRMLLLPFFVIIISIYYVSFPILYLNFILSLVSGITLAAIIKMKWQLNMIRNLTITLIFCGLLFSSVSYLNRITDMKPDRDIIRSLEWLESYSSEHEIVLSHYSRGFWISYFSRNNVMLDPRFEYDSDAEAKYNDTLDIFYSRRLVRTKELLSEHRIKYIWIDSEMKQGLVWKEEQEGLLFLFRNNETFKNIYSYQGIEIWEVLR